MGDPRGERLVRELVRDLAPVEPVPRLRSAALAAVAVFAAALLASGWLGGAWPGAAVRAFGAEPPFLLLLAGMALAGLGGLGACLAGSVPGRESAARVGRRTALLGGLLVAAGAAAWAAGPGTWGAGLAGGLDCTARAALLGLAPALVAAGFAARCRTPRSLAASLLASAGGVALGALAVQLTCSQPAVLHVAIGHCAGPLVSALLLAAPLWLWIGRRTRSA